MPEVEAEIDESMLSEQTRLEREAGRKALAMNSAAYEKAIAARDAVIAAEKAAAEPTKAEEDAGMAEATAEAEAQAVAKGKGFPRATKPYKGVTDV